jgi:uncharacterized protein YdeI (YjbR/CyaY-like superfamily)
MENKRISKDFKTKYEELSFELNKKVRAINCGGCGCYAISLSDTLKELGYQHKFVVVFHRKESLINGKKFLQEENMTDFLHCGWTHIMLKVNGKLIDSEGIFNNLSDRYQESRKYHSIVDERYVKELVDNEDVWNPMFDRKHVKKIETIMKKHLVNSN